ncbi:MAG: hypothetical protein WC718_04885 [Phycisphaerales bacterium]|jgi:lipid-A-disaccharide synthase
MPSVLFTAFEPSGDDHAAAVIAELRARHPKLPMFAWGGRNMARAGATIIEHTGDDAVMGMPGLQKILEHKRINQRIDTWLGEHKVAVHVPVDSPAANTSICEIAKRHGVKVVHLVAPQIWAWGRWRIGKLRRLTDLVLCMLPFETAFFTKRRVPARYIGHFLFDKQLDTEALDRRAAALAEGPVRLALMPGSRPDELKCHFPTLLGAFRLIRQKHPEAVGVVAATSDAVSDYLRKMAESHGGWPDGLGMVVRDTDTVIRWCTLAIVKSGTVTLQVAKQRRPMVVFYQKTNPGFFVMAKFLVATKVFSLPNVLAGRRIITELIPYFGGPKPLANAVEKLIEEPALVEKQQADMDNVLAAFANINAAGRAADAIEEVLGLREDCH